VELFDEASSNRNTPARRRRSGKCCPGNSAPDVFTVLARASPPALYRWRVQVDREALPRSKPHAMFGGRFARDLWRLTCIYWASPAARQGALLLALAIALEFGTVYGNVLIAMTQKHVGDAVQDKQMSEFFAAMARFFGVVLAFVL